MVVGNTNLNDYFKRKRKGNFVRIELRYSSLGVVSYVFQLNSMCGCTELDLSSSFFIGKLHKVSLKPTTPFSTLLLQEEEMPC